ncbi:hypothetical protein [Caldilinea sp.]|uniref:hypothetical protein n=1 Tax=Caldilinea sp. TaxID=2293560 RepID=UPI0031CC52FA
MTHSAPSCSTLSDAITPGATLPDVAAIPADSAIVTLTVAQYHAVARAGIEVGILLP